MTKVEKVESSHAYKINVSKAPFRLRARTLIWAPCPGTGTSSRGSARDLCPGTNLNRLLSVPSVSTFSQTVETVTLNLSLISRQLVPFPSCL